MLEAMGSGLPVVASRVGGIPEMVTHGSDGLIVPPADAMALAEAIELLLADDELRRSMGDAARERVRTCFSEASFVSSVSELYDDLLTYALPYQPDERAEGACRKRRRALPRMTLARGRGDRPSRARKAMSISLSSCWTIVRRKR